MDCVICYERYSSEISFKRRPLLLPCGHEACESCVEQLHKSNSQVIKCPMCKTQHRVNHSSLPVVYALIQDSTSNKCTEDANCKGTACINCPHCKDWFCCNHFTDHHNGVLEFCTEFLFETEKKLLKYKSKKSSLTTLLTNTKEKYETIKKLTREMQALSREFRNTVEVQEKLLKSLSKIESSTTEFVEDFKSDVKSRNDFDKTWIKLKEFKNTSHVSENIKIPHKQVKVLHERFDNLMKVNSKLVLNPSKDRTLLSLSRQAKTVPVTKLSEMPKHIANFETQPIDVVVVENTRGFSLEERIVVKSFSGLALPSPALLVKSVENRGNIVVCNYNGEVRGEIKLKYDDPRIVAMAVRDDDNYLFISDFNKKCVMKLLLSGDVIATSKPGFLIDPWGVCCLPDRKLAVCDRKLKAVKILLETDLSVVISLKHPHIRDPFKVVVTSSRLIIINLERQARLLFFCLSKFIFKRRGKDEINLPRDLIHYGGTLFISTFDNEVIQISSQSRTRLLTIGSQGDGLCQFNKLGGLAVTCSPSGEETLVVADRNNFRLKFYSI